MNINNPTPLLHKIMITPESGDRPGLHIILKATFAIPKRAGEQIEFAHPDGRKTTIPDHGNKDVPHGLMLKIIREDLEMSIDDFFDFDYQSAQIQIWSISLCHLVLK